MIPTAEEFLKTKQYDYAEDVNTTECMIEFAKLHIEEFQISELSFTDYLKTIK